MKYSEVHYVISGYKEISCLHGNYSSLLKRFISLYSQRLCAQGKYNTFFFFFNQEKDCIKGCTRSQLPTTLEFLLSGTAWYSKEQMLSNKVTDWGSQSTDL